MKERTRTHTPGPWQWHYYCGIRALTNDVDLKPGSVPILSPIIIDTWASSFEEGTPDALLIAAAPDLLAACRLAIEYLDDLSSDADYYHGKLTLPIRAAIKKATEIGQGLEE